MQLQQFFKGTEMQNPCVCHNIQIQQLCLAYRDNLTFVNLTQQHLKCWSNAFNVHNFAKDFLKLFFNCACFLLGH